MPFEIRVTHSSRRRRVAFRIASDGVVEVCSPVGVPRSELDRICAANFDRIERLRRRVLAARRGADAAGRFCDGGKLWLFGEERILVFASGNPEFDGEFRVPAGDEREVKAAVTSIYRHLAVEFIPGRVALLSENLNRRPISVGITGASTRWGSCNRRGGLNFSWRVMQLPGVLIDYVIWHELTHLEHFDHSPLFWAALESRCPRSDELRRQLRTLGRKLPDF